jgi:hypothetical protein
MSMPMGVPKKNSTTTVAMTITNPMQRKIRVKRTTPLPPRMMRKRKIIQGEPPLSLTRNYVLLMELSTLAPEYTRTRSYI